MNATKNKFFANQLKKVIEKQSTDLSDKKFYRTSLASSFRSDRDIFGRSLETNDTVLGFPGQPQ